MRSASVGNVRKSFKRMLRVVLETSCASIRPVRPWAFAVQAGEPSLIAAPDTEQ